MLKKLLLISVGVFGCLPLIFSQEFQSKITVNASRVNSTVDKKIFTTLQTQLTNFMNSRKWTSDVYKQSEKIEANFIVNIESIVEQNVYKAQLMIQSARPVFNSTYQTALINFQDVDLTFKYIEYQPVEFNETRVQGSDALVANLTACFAYYANMILGLNYDSFAPKAGEKYFLKAQNIVNNAPESSNISGWKTFDGLRNRYWLSENLSNPRNNILHDVIYSYYRSGLDKMYENEKEARGNILQSLTQLKAFNTDNPNSMFVQFFMQSKAIELTGIFKKGSSEEKTKAVDILTVLDITNGAKYRTELQ